MQLPDHSYVGRHAELYDLFYSDKPYSDEAAFINKLIQTFKPNARRLLELACGTGAHSLSLEKEYGYTIVATDYSPGMLARAKEKAKQAGSSIDFRMQDMRDLDLPEHSFDAVICLFDSIGYVATNENILKVLTGIHKQLAPGGVFIFEFWHAGAMLSQYDPLRIRRFKTLEGDITRVSETRIDYKEQLCHVAYTVNELRVDGSYQTIQETQVNRFFLLQEMSFFLQQSGFLPLKWYSGYQDDEQIREDTWHVVAVALRKE